jgi:hypothetical protein
VGCWLSGKEWVANRRASVFHERKRGELRVTSPPWCGFSSHKTSSAFHTPRKPEAEAQKTLRRANYRKHLLKRQRNYLTRLRARCDFQRLCSRLGIARFAPPTTEKCFRKLEHADARNSLQSILLHVLLLNMHC